MVDGLKASEIKKLAVEHDVSAYTAQKWLQHRELELQLENATTVDDVKQVINTLLQKQQPNDYHLFLRRLHERVSTET